jgi:hypothetical protein
VLASSPFFLNPGECRLLAAPIMTKNGDFLTPLSWRKPQPRDGSNSLAR